MSFSNDDYPFILEKLIEEFDRCGGQMTTNDFKTFLFGMRFTKEDLDKIENLDENTKKQLLRIRLDKRAVSDFKRWLNLNGYLTINHEYQRETVVLKND